MPIIQPFNGVFYHPNQQKNLSQLVAPPYDVITAEYKQELLARDPHNIIRLILGKSAQEKGKPRPEKEYQQAAETLKAWRQEHILVSDQKPAFYYLEEKFSALGKLYCRKGFIGLLELDELSSRSVLPHEKTMSGPKEDRLKLMSSCRADFSQIFTLYDDPDLVIEQELQQHRQTRKPFISLKSLVGIERRIWPVRNPTAIERIREVLTPQSLFIADGHHRFETALNYRQLRRQQEGNPDSRQPYDYVMVYCTNTSSTDLAILPTHRLVSGYPGLNREMFTEKMGELFQLSPLEPDTQDPKAIASHLLQVLNQQGDGNHFIAVIGKRPDCFLVSLETRRGQELMKGIPTPLASLDVSVLDHLLFNQTLGISAEDMETQRYTSFSQDAATSVESIMKGENQLAVLLRPTDINQVKSVAAAGEKMPQKSTFFYPKLLTGLILYLFGD
ncbi:MAG: DUF1015 domain-containing protein [Deltaproteobacteria bacterium]|nr:DUF1015 domain-containing protein [Deltaproteobacteria bacterium]